MVKLFFLKGDTFLNIFVIYCLPNMKLIGQINRTKDYTIIIVEIVMMRINI